jgi:hypothetical protein
MSKKEVRHGFKFLNPYGATLYKGVETIYPLPRPNEKWGPWFKHPHPAIPDGFDCGQGRWHVMKHINAAYAPKNWHPWFVQARGVTGESREKFGTPELRLRRITNRVFWKIIRMGYCQRADLFGANLRYANLEDADLHSANLRYANLDGANLVGADLRYANLDGANLVGADLRYADLRYADLRYANLDGANLEGARLTNTILDKK